ncbi:hypothetical protein [Paracoccus chinensis]|uniref:Uncharacterized protein n=1 Tax=Paracoccus chinensis TaxID=525640 RepID=A0A1G9JY70_9RHOB|nr:hypothetical protein [Paracoccus chinensis]SDL42005.1 hypothetical protein SAMN04487971_11079 [Paracoccus chinensis]
MVPVPVPVACIGKDRQIKLGGTDEMGNKVEDIFVSTDQFIIYSATRNKNKCTCLRYILPDNYETARDYRRKLTPVVNELASVGDVLSGICGTHFGRSHTLLKTRTLDLMAQAMQMAFEDRPESAAILLDQARIEVTGRRDSRNRMRYIFANGVALTVLLLAIWFVPWGALALTALDNVLTAPQNLPGASNQYRLADVLALGAIGAFFSVSGSIRSIRVDHSISMAEMIYAGFVRVPIGVIGAGIMVLLISGGWILGAVEQTSVIWSLYLFAFLAGFSEMLVPNALKQAEALAPIERPMLIETKATERTSEAERTTRTVRSVPQQVQGQLP